MNTCSVSQGKGTRHTHGSQWRGQGTITERNIPRNCSCRRHLRVPLGGLMGSERPHVIALLVKIIADAGSSLEPPGTLRSSRGGRSRSAVLTLRVPDGTSRSQQSRLADPAREQSSPSALPLSRGVRASRRHSAQGGVGDSASPSGLIQRRHEQGLLLLRRGKAGSEPGSPDLQPCLRFPCILEAGFPRITPYACLVLSSGWILGDIIPRPLGTIPPPPQRCEAAASLGTTPEV